MKGKPMRNNDDFGSPSRRRGSFRPKLLPIAGSVSDPRRPWIDPRDFERPAPKVIAWIIAAIFCLGAWWLVFHLAGLM